GGLLQAAIVVGTVIADVATDGAATPLLLEEAGAEAGGEAAAVGAGEVAAGAEAEGEAAGAAAEGDSSAASCANSFVAGTPVLLANGKTVPIQRIGIGTRVATVDQDNP